MEILYKRYSLIMLEYKQKTNELKVVFVPAHLKIDNISPVYVGKIVFERNNGMLRPTRYSLSINQRQNNFPSKDFIKAIKDVKKIIIPSNTLPEFKREITEMLRDFQIPKNKIIEADICPYCKINNRYTILGNNRFKTGNREICLKCAKKELIRELTFRGLDKTTKIANYLEKMLIKIKDVDKVLNFIFTQKFVFNPELTRYDIIPAEKHIDTMEVDELDIPELLKKSLENRGITKLLPAQTLAVKEGLLNGENLLIVSATSSGKTLLGELTGIKRVLNSKKRFLFLVPLVALANQLYNDFKERYTPLGLRVAIKVGMPRINVGEEELVIIDDDIKNADIIIATYEGFDVVLRDGLGALPDNIGTIVIDEIQMLSDEERGYELEGLISRLKLVYPDSQLICLSATIGNPKEIASLLKLKLINYLGRPVKLERHLILALSENDKMKSIVNLVKSERKYISKYGYKGQTIIFTNSRKKTEEIADYLNRNQVKAVAYHAGMTYAKRKKIEESYISGIYQAIVTTFALGAGFDAPCSQVIFESLMMGKDYLTVTMFNQMLGRAGRLGRHDRGKVVLIVEIGKKIRGASNETEDRIAIRLLEGEIEPVQVVTNFDKAAEQLLAIISVFNEITYTKLKSSLKYMTSIKEELDKLLQYLSKDGLIDIGEDKIKITKLGKNVTTSFLNIEQTRFILQNIEREDYIDIAIKLEPFESAYLSNRTIEELSRIFRIRFPTRLFSGSLLGTIDTKNVKLYKKIPEWLVQVFTKWLSDIFNCKCKESPFCDCGKITLSRKIIELRKIGLTPRNISNELYEEYDIYAYPGDIFNWLETFLHNLNGVKKISEFLGDTRTVYEITETIKRIEEPV
ncbi:MAG: DUF5814 domain-containing protein [Candidatus Odinarchaeia archaeon]